MLRDPTLELQGAATKHRRSVSKRRFCGPAGRAFGDLSRSDRRSIAVASQASVRPASCRACNSRSRSTPSSRSMRSTALRTPGRRISSATIRSRVLMMYLAPTLSFDFVSELVFALAAQQLKPLNSIHSYSIRSTEVRVRRYPTSHNSPNDSSLNCVVRLFSTYEITSPGFSIESLNMEIAAWAVLRILEPFASGPHDGRPVAASRS